jgi:plasmid stabilization system protein ParE
MPEAETDVDDLYNVIAFGFCQLLTADRYLKSLDDAIRRLSLYAGSIAPSQYRYIQSRYGPNARHITCKKMTIIYTIINDTVLIKRVIPAKLIR